MNHANLFLAFALSLAILFGFHWFYERPRMEAYRQALAQSALQQQTAPPQQQTSNTPPVAAAAPARERAELLKAGRRVPISTPALLGSINLTGARIDDLTLPQYRETVDPASPPITLLSPSGAAKPHPGYYAEFGWLGENVPGLPDAQTVWQAEGNATLTPSQPVTLRWNNGQGLRFERVIALDEHYMFTITDRVFNDNDGPATLHPYALVMHQTKPDRSDLIIGHTGPMGVLGGVLKEHSYDKMIAEPVPAESSTGGWIGISSKYWLVALIPPQQDAITANFKFARQDEQPPEDGRFQIDYRGAPITIGPKSSAEYTRRLFAGAKQVELIDQYRDQYGIEKFDLSIDFGWFKFLTKPLLYTLNWLGGKIGNVGVAILVLTVLVKFLVLPLGLKSFRSMAKMKKIQPELKRLNERYKDDKQRQTVEMMELYKREKVSPISGCLPIIAQLPVFFALYKVLNIGIDIRHAPFFGWIQDLSAPDPTSFFNLFGLAPWSIPALNILHIGVWPILMGISMFGLQKMNPPPPDPVQAQVMMMMPLIFTVMLAPQMASGLIIYWTWSNLISIAQQLFIYRRMGVKAID